ncbi:Uncharacterized protein APZ42_000190 [Daphnia magna]|uniref:Uncharacterized protein n=1 Tax=Daphnia magna TaxID=35525 RepID=A0A164JUS3_9CRUS|nr:Uncharacterized protein APZ42_000190 [Daphnia magna]
MIHFAANTAPFGLLCQNSNCGTESTSRRRKSLDIRLYCDLLTSSELQVTLKNSWTTLTKGRDSLTIPLSAM